MWRRKSTVKFLKSFLPHMAELIMLQEPYGKPAVIIEDIDSDGSAEIIGVYKWQDECYISILKYHNGVWYTAANIKLSGWEIISARDLVRLKIKLQEKLKLRTSHRTVNLYPAPLRIIEGIKWGYINKVGQFVIKPQYDYAYDFQDNGLAIVGKNGLYGIIDSTGKFIVALKYDSIEQFSEGRAAVTDSKGFKVIDESGRELTTKSYSFIGRYQNGRALIGDNNAQGQYVYGYLDREGKEIIPPKYESAYDFKNGKAVVKIKDKSFAIINLSGSIINSYNYNFVGNLGDGLLPFQPTEGGKYGYIDESGRIVIQPKFTGAESFNQGRAVVNTSEDFEPRFGLIDRNGSFIIKPEYDEINNLMEGRFSVGRAIVKDKPFMGKKYAVADSNGRFLTDFIYTNVSEYTNGLASASDDKNTFFIDKTGRVVKSLPIVSGSGTMSYDGDLIKAFVDFRTTYFNSQGKVVWKQNTTIPVNNQYTIHEEKYKPNKDYLVYYPQLEGMKNKQIQQSVNEKLKVLSQVKPINPEEQLEYSYTGDFDVQFFKKRLLVFELNGYNYPFGAAHGMPSKVYPHIDLESGRFYELKDLFKPNSNYVKVLSDIIGEQIKTNPEYNYVFPDSYKGIKPDQPFYVGADELYIYFEPYEIAPYAAGFPTFKIPYKEIMNIINTKGNFWRAFN